MNGHIGFICIGTGPPDIISLTSSATSVSMIKFFSFDLFIFYFFKYKNLEIVRPKIFYKKRLHGNSHWQKGFVSEFILTKNMILSKKSWIKNIKKADLKELE